MTTLYTTRHPDGALSNFGHSFSIESARAHAQEIGGDVVSVVIDLSDAVYEEVERWRMERIDHPANQPVEQP